MDDLIRRQAVTKFLNDWLSCLFENCHKQSASDLKMIIKDFKNLPSIQSERKTGRWIYGESEVGNDGYYCSECGNFVPWIYEESAMNFIREYKFCPNCGADMRGEQDG